MTYISSRMNERSTALKLHQSTVLYFVMTLFTLSYIAFYALRGESSDLFSSITRVFVPFCVVSIFTLVVGRARISKAVNVAIVYALFFSVSATSIFGFTKTLTGSHAESSSILFYGLSFYTAYLAFSLHRGALTAQTPFIAANPLLLLSGPIPITFSSLKVVKLKRRLLYFLPFAIIGMFFYKIIAFQLGRFLWMVEYTDPLHSLGFAVVFELFVYFNFAGISLLVFAFFGVLGVRIPLNFKQPFSARNLVEFWQGWHTSLSGVLKEIFYLPLRKRFGSVVAVFGVFLSSALWHGVTFNFVLWGLFHASAFALTVVLLKSGQKILSSLLFIPTVIYGRMLFADSDTTRLIQKIFMQGDSATVIPQSIHDEGWFGLLFALIFVGMEFVFARKRLFRQRTYKYLRTPFSVIVLVAMIVLFMHSGGGAEYAVYGQR